MLRSGLRWCIAPSMWLRKVTPSSVELAQLGEAHHLEAARVGQDRPLPVHEAVQPAEPRHPLGAGPQHQVVGVAEQHVGAGRARTLSGSIALTVPAVPTGMKAGVRMSPRGVREHARRARRPSPRLDAKRDARSAMSPAP